MLAALQIWIWPQVSFALPSAPFKINPIQSGMSQLYSGPAHLGTNTFGANILRASGQGVEIAGQVILPAISKKQNAIRAMRTGFEKAKKAGKVAGQFTLSLIPESIVFFVALGAVSRTQLWMNFADNPVSWEQHLMAHDLTTPEGWVGVAALAAFMMAARGSESLMYKLLANSKNSKYFLPLVPYTGMSVGLLASTLVHEIHNKDQLLACTASLEKRIQNEEQWETCEKAYDDFMDLGYEKMQDLMPVLMGMIGSTIVGAALEVNTIQKLLSIPKKIVSKPIGFDEVNQKVVRASVKELRLGFIFQHGAQLASIASPWGVGQRFIRLAYRAAAQFYPQTVIQNAIEPSFTTWWKNFSDGGDLAKLETDIMEQLDFKKRNGWKVPLTREFGDLYLSLSKLSQYSMDWRKGNIHSWILAHQNWLNYLSSFSQMYLASMDFYKHYINEYNNRYIRNTPAMFDMSYPFSGVEPLIPQQQNGQEIIVQPEIHNKDTFEKLQMLQMAEARQRFEKVMADNEAELKKLAPETVQAFRKTLDLMPTAEEFKAGQLRRNDAIQALVNINKALEVKLDTGLPFFKLSAKLIETKIAPLQQKLMEIEKDQKLSKEEKEKKSEKLENEISQILDENSDNSTKSYEDVRELYSGIRKALGNPKPVSTPGYGYLKAYESYYGEEGNLAGLKFPETEKMTDQENNGKWSSLGDAANATMQILGFADEFNSGWRVKTNTINYHHATQYLTGQIALGPQAQSGQSVISINRSGFPSRFLPPRLVPSYPYKFLFDEAKLLSSNSRNTIFNTPVLVGSNQMKYPNLIDVVRNQNVLPEIIQHKDGFMGWWKEKVESQYATAWQKFEDEYQKIMVGIYEQYKYYNKADLSWNTFRRSGLSYAAPLSNGLQLSYRQERRLYLLILGEMLKDQMKGLDAENPLLKVGKDNSPAASAGRDLKMGPVGSMKETLKNRCPYVAGVDQSKCLAQQKMNLDIATIKYIPLLDFLKSSETYSLAQIVESYKDKQFPSYEDTVKQKHFQFQDEIELLYQNLEWYLDQIKVTEVKPEKASILTDIGLESFETTRKILVSNVTNQQLRDMQDKIEKKISVVGEQFKAINKSEPEKIKIIEACLRGLKSIANQTAEIGRMINAVSYERSDEKAKNEGETICETNSYVANKVGLGGAQTPYKRKACKKDKNTPAAQNPKDSPSLLQPVFPKPMEQDSKPVVISTFTDSTAETSHQPGDIDEDGQGDSDPVIQLIDNSENGASKPGT